MTSIPKTTHIIVVGAGWAGQGVCEALGAETPPNTVVTCIDAREELAIGATWQFGLDGRAKPMEVPLSKTSAAKFLRKGTVQSVDYAAKHVNLQFGVLPYDHLVLACGAVSDPSTVAEHGSTIQGLAEHCVDLTAKKNFTDDIERFLDAVEPGGKTKRVVISITKCPYKCPPLPFEVACLIDDAAKRRGKGVRDAVSITVTSPVIWPFGGPKAKKAFTEAMAAKNITYLRDTQIRSIDEQDGRKLVKVFPEDYHKFAGGEELVADLVLATFPHRAPDFVKDLAKAKGSIPVDLRTNAVAGKEGVYCVGDACAALIPSAGVPIPKAGEFAYKAGLALGKRLAALVRGEEAALPTERSARCVAETGGGQGITVGPNFDAAFADPENGKPAFAIEPHADGTTAKVAWIQGYLDRFAPDQGIVFEAGAPRNAEG
jgi:sulfide:quinone oxidoreductase